MRILGIDYGDSRIGIAVSDPFGWTAQGLETIEWKNSMQKLMLKIEHLVDEYNVNKIVVGFPKNMDGTVGFRGEKTEEFIKTLKTHVCHVEVVKWDERLTTVAAHRVMRETGVKAVNKKGMLDRLAAVYILQGYLDSLQNNA